MTPPDSLASLPNDYFLGCSASDGASEGLAQCAKPDLWDGADNGKAIVAMVARDYRRPCPPYSFLMLVCNPRLICIILTHFEYFKQHIGVRNGALCINQGLAISETGADLNHVTNAQRRAIVELYNSIATYGAAVDEANVSVVERSYGIGQHIP
ncbi:hypothetical protein MY4824_001484 [Beauveria thailandica]